MSDPLRWRDPSGGAPPGLRELIADARKTRALTAAERARSVAHAAKLSEVFEAASGADVTDRVIAILQRAGSQPTAFRVAVPASTDTPGKGPLPREAALLVEAAARIATSPEEALGLLEAHQKAFPQGDFGGYREALTVCALAHAGRRREASERVLAVVAILRERLRSTDPAPMPARSQLWKRARDHVHMPVPWITSGLRKRRGE